MLLASSLSAQITVTQFNASWNASNDVEWCDDLTDCDLAYVDISKEPSIQKEHNEVLVPTIIVFNGEEVERFQADISFTIQAKLEDILPQGNMNKLNNNLNEYCLMSKR